MKKSKERRGNERGTERERETEREEGAREAVREGEREKRGCTSEVEHLFNVLEVRDSIPQPSKTNETMNRGSKEKKKY